MSNTIKEKILEFATKVIIITLVVSFFMQTFAAFPLYAFTVNEEKINVTSINEVNQVDEEDIKLLYELEEYRSDYGKVFMRSDGKLEYSYYDQLANYYDGEKFVEVDASFKSYNNDFNSSINNYSVKLPKKINENKKISNLNVNLKNTNEKLKKEHEELRNQLHLADMELEIIEKTKEVIKTVGNGIKSAAENVWEGIKKFGRGLKSLFCW